MDKLIFKGFILELKNCSKDIVIIWFKLSIDCNFDIKFQNPDFEVRMVLLVSNLIFLWFFPKTTFFDQAN